MNLVRRPKASHRWQARRPFLRFLLIFLLIFLLTPYCTKKHQKKHQIPETSAAFPSVAILKSEYTASFYPHPSLYYREFQHAVEVLKLLGIKPAILEDKEIVDSLLLRHKLLILPNTKNMSSDQVKAVLRYAKKGGKVLAFYMSSYRDENDQPAGKINNFQLSNLFGADYLRWNAHSPHCQFLVRAMDHPLWTFPQKIELGRNKACLIKPHQQSNILAMWYDADGKTPSQIKSLAAAIILNDKENCIYVGENLLLPQNSNSPDVLRLIASLINYLLPETASTEKIPSEARLPQVASYYHLPPLSIKKEEKEIDIGLKIDAKDIYVTSDGRYQVFDNNKRCILRKKEGEYIHIIKGNILISPQNPSKLLYLIDFHSNGSYNLKAYRGKLIIESGNPLKIKNRLDISEYLAGVVPHEVPFHFHQEALKAMAVIARTFTLKHIGKHRSEGYDLCSTVHCQAYDGVLLETFPTTKSVNETRGEVLMFGEKLADTPYHSTCGGITENIEEIWQHHPLPYLKAVADQKEPLSYNLKSEEGIRSFITGSTLSYCRHSSRYRWEETYSLKELEALFSQSLPLLLNKNISLGRLLDLRITSRTSHGRVKILQIITETGKYEIASDKLRWLFSGGKVGLGGLPSTLFYIETYYDTQGQPVKFVFRGGGWGHGVGMCQFGAQGMAKEGYNYREIIRHYYPGISIKRWK